MIMTAFTHIIVMWFDSGEEGKKVRWIINYFGEKFVGPSSCVASTEILQ